MAIDTPNILETLPIPAFQRKIVGALSDPNYERNMIEQQKTAIEQARRVNEARQFRQDLPMTERALGEDLRSVSRRNLAEDLSNIRRNYNRRGLLFSGLRQGGEAQTRGQHATNLAGGLSDLRGGLREQADLMEQQAVQSGLDFYQTRKAAADAAYNRALQRVMSNRAGLGNLMSFGGSMAGAYFGSKS